MAISLNERIEEQYKTRTLPLGSVRVLYCILLMLVNSCKEFAALQGLLSLPSKLRLHLPQ